MIVVGKRLYAWQHSTFRGITEMNGGTVAILAGVLIVVAGIALLGVQVMEGSGKQIEEQSFNIISAEAGSSKLQVETGFPGVPVIALGMLLLIVGAIASRSNQ